MRRITKIQGSQHAGILNGWSMSSSVEAFSRVNVIYGGNGSGKSTLARVLSRMTSQEPSDTVLHVDVDVNVNGTVSSKRQVTESSDPFWSRLRVFDKQFVGRNLLFDVNGRSDALALLVLGEPNVQRDQRLAEIDDRLKVLSKALPDARKQADAATKAARKVATDTARTIGQELQVAGGRFSARSYDARRVVDSLSSVDTAVHERSDDEIAADLRVVQGQRLEPLEVVQRTAFAGSSQKRVGEGPEPSGIE